MMQIDEINFRISVQLARKVSHPKYTRTQTHTNTHVNNEYKRIQGFNKSHR